MTGSEAEPSARVAEMRREFDGSFARPASAEPEATEDLLRVTAGGRGFLVRLRELSAVLPCALSVPVPGARPGLLGLAAVRGQILPLYSLAVLLDLPSSAGVPRWILVPSGATPAALGVEEMEGISRLPTAAVREAASGARRELRDASGPRTMVEIGTVVESLRKTGIA